MTLRTAKIILSCAILFCLVLVNATGAMADTLNYSGVPGGDASVNGADIGPYLGGLNGISLDLYCADPYHDTGASSWSVNVTNLASGNLSNTLLKNQTLYQQIAFLYFFDGFATQSTAERQAMQAAVWYLASNGASPYGAAFGDSMAYVNAARNAALGNFNFSGVSILTDPGALYQEFMVMTPEPTTMILFGTGLIGIAGRFVNRKRRRAS